MTKELLPGMLLAFAVGIIAILLGEIIPALGSITLALLAGILTGNLFKISSKYHPGLNFTSNKLLEISVLFLAIGINFNHISRIGISSFLFLSIAILLVLLISYFLARKFSDGRDAALMTGFGTAICGSSAIAAVSPAISANKEETAISLAVVNLLGLGGMLGLPVLLNFIGAEDLRSGFIIGGSLHSVANVAGAGLSVGEETGKIAITIKLARVALLSPALILYSYLIKRNSVKSWKEHFKLPWYIWGFIFITIIVSFVEVPKTLVKFSETSGKIILSVALAAIGLKVGLRTLYNSGKKALLFGILVFLIQLSLLGVFSYLI